MSSADIENLIDFGAEDGIQMAYNLHPPHLNGTNSNPSNPAVIYEKVVLTNLPMLASWPTINGGNSSKSKRESFDNNPFDRVEKLANRPSDPFDIVEKEATEKGRSFLPQQEVEIGNLLSISDDSLLKDKQLVKSKDKQYILEDSINNKTPNASPEIYPATKSKPYEKNCINVIDMMTPPLKNLAETLHSLSSANERTGNTSSSGSDGNSAKIKKIIDRRKRLLKLSISNSALNSPISRNVSLENNASSSELESFSKLVADAEFSAKLSEDDLMSEEPNWVDSDRDFEAELEMLNIPMLKELPPQVDDQCQSNINALNEQQNQKIFEELIDIPKKEESSNFIDLDAIRSKLKAKRNEINNKNDILKIVDNLKALICNHESGSTIQQQASNLLDTLSKALGSETEKGSSNLNTSETFASNLDLPPKPIVRQGTFDIELQDIAGKDSQQIPLSEMSEEIPVGMIKSTATYDGESIVEKDFFLPEIDPLSSQPLPITQTSPSAQKVSHDINDIVEQIGKLLEQQHSNMHGNESNDGSLGSSLNPTLIVVMNTTPSMSSQQSLYTSSQSEISTIYSFDASPDLAHYHNIPQRRRSQSFSLHDKIKVLHLPLRKTDSNSEIKNTDLLTVPAMETLGCKTPLHSKMRRNSFSNASNYTSMTNPNANQRRMSCAGDGVGRVRHSNILSTHHEQRQNVELPTASAVVRPMPQLNLNALKPEKKKIKSTSAVKSILKSAGPMKATIPVKKVAPMIKVTPSTPESIKSKIKSASTPRPSLPQAEESSAISYVPTGIPSACSTPAVDRGYLRRATMGGEYKPRFSYIPTTPTSKNITPVAADNGAKRRTLNEVKSKSSIKQRVNAIAGGSLKTPTPLIATTRRTLKSPQQSAAKATNNSSSAAKNTIRASHKSNAGISGTNKNKENKKP